MDPLVKYRLINSSVCLNVRRPPPYISGKWMFGGKVIASGLRMNPNFTEKVVYSPGNLSLCINKLTAEDAGIYEVSFDDHNFTPLSEKHQVIIQDRVPQPVMSVHHSNLSADPCRITVNCSFKEDWASSVCNPESCRTSQTSINNMININISTGNGNVVCRGNNHVSENRASLKMAACFTETNLGLPKKSQKHIIVLVAVFVGTLICSCIILSAVRINCRRKEPQVIHSQPGESTSHSEPRASAASSSQADPSYENVDAAQPGSLESPPADAIYSIPDVLASEPKSSSSKKSEGRGNMEEASTSASAALDESQPDTGPDTVYCLLQRAKSDVTVPPTG